MPKLDNDRDYYGDLGLTPSADDQEIKRQFRKLALQYHPDRNPGREAEVNSKFQIIQSAHEILSDPELKAKYDVGRRSRFPGPSGVKGNPWSDVGKNFPAPPRRAGQDRSSRNPPPSGAHKYRNFTSGAAPTAKQQPRDDPMEARRSAWQAFEHMRPNSQGKSAASQANRRPVPPRPTEPAAEPASRPVPRTPGQKQRAEAAFGGRKTGYEPRSPVPGDEPSVSSSSYSTNRHTYDAASATPHEPIPDPLAQFREKCGEDRHSSPYSSSSGEKVDPFDGAPLGRAKSTREGSRPDQQESDHLSPGGARNRSSSAPRSATPNEASKSQQGSPTGANFPQRKPFVSRASARYTPAGVTPSNSGPGTPTGVNGTGQGYAPGDTNKPNGPTMYDNTNFYQHSSFSFKVSQGSSRQASAQSYHYPYGNGTSPATSRKVASKTSSSQSSLSGDGISNLTLSPYERHQQEVLEDLITNAYSPVVQQRKRHISRSNTAVLDSTADKNWSNSFTFPVDDETFSPTSPSATRFTRSSADDINTRFVNDQGSDAWKFTAGSPTSEDPLKKRRTQSGSRLGRQSPQGPPPRPPKEPEDGPQPAPATDAKWDAQGWAGIGAQDFAPQPAQAPSVSPTRQPTRTNSRKPKVKQTAGTAGIVNDDSSSDERRDANVRRPNVEAPHADSPSAMDIDSPPPPQPSNLPQQASTARNIPVEPSRPEWRPGNAQGVPESPLPKQAQKTAFNPNAAGSEDSDEFRASFADLRNVAPFAPQGSGLNSFSDLKTNLPFESRASHRPAPHEKRKPPPPLPFPEVPRAPNPPAALAINNLKPSTSAWQKYLQEFQEYMQRWDTFSCAVTDHFAARKQLILGARGARGYSFLTTQGTEGIQEYLEWVQQDKDVRRQWTVACDEHEQRVKDFLAYRVQMMR